MTDRSVDSVPLGESIGENLARLRKVRDLSQERLAEAADVGVDTVAVLSRPNARTSGRQRYASSPTPSAFPLTTSSDGPRPGDLTRSISADCVAPSRRTANFAADLLAEAEAAAVRKSADFANEAAIFGPRVTGIQRVDHAVRTGDPERALHLADTMETTEAKTPPFWEAGYNVCLAAAANELRKDGRALLHLARAYELAPGWAPAQPLGRLAMRRLVDRAARRRGEEFSRLATLCLTEAGSQQSFAGPN